MVKVKSGLSGLSIARTVEVSRTPLLKLEGNPNFPNLPYPVAEMQGDRNALIEYQSLFLEGNRGIKPLRDQTLKGFRSKMSITADYINTVAKGDVIMLNTTGLPFEKERSAKPVPAMIHKINACNCPETGVAKVTWSGVSGRNYYIIQSTMDPSDENSWKQVEQSTTVHCDVYGLEVGKFAHFRVCAVNSAGRGEWSDVAKIMVA